jgi:2-polyprenyl-3-methyl-5-hydroxy-6-metoxy-1,4-benzoquinol methylase
MVHQWDSSSAEKMVDPTGQMMVSPMAQYSAIATVHLLGDLKALLTGNRWVPATVHQWDLLLVA